jgi:hypothetical protein
LATKKELKMTIKLELEQNEVQAIMNVLGDMPTKSGAYMLLVKIGSQANEQMPKEQPAAE